MSAARIWIAWITHFPPSTCEPHFVTVFLVFIREACHSGACTFGTLFTVPFNLFFQRRFLSILNHENSNFYSSVFNYNTTTVSLLGCDCYIFFYFFSANGTTEEPVSPSPGAIVAYQLENKYVTNCQFCRHYCYPYAIYVKRHDGTWGYLRECRCYNGYQLEPNGRSCTSRCQAHLLIFIICNV